MSLNVNAVRNCEMSNNKKPEHQAPPEIFYNEDEAAKYTDLLSGDPSAHYDQVLFFISTPFFG